MGVEQFVLSQEPNKFPLSASELIRYIYSSQAEQYMFMKPPNRVRDLVEYYIQHGAEVTAVYHPVHGWFILKNSQTIVAWWRKKR